MAAVTPEALKNHYSQEAGEIALLDVREYGEYGMAHPFHAVNVPYSRFEIELTQRVPRHDVPVVLLDQQDEGRARHCAELAQGLGYRNVQYLAGGLNAWQTSGYNVFSGVNVVSKTFGELVHERFHTPSISPTTLATWQAEGKPVMVIDGRPVSEYRKMNIPGSICCPNGELARRLPAILGSDSQVPVVINCAGRTRSIIGAQTLCWLGIENPLYALDNGTQGWRLAGLELEYHSDRCYPRKVAPLARISERAQDLAARHGACGVDATTVNDWLSESSRTTYVFDVRSTEEYRQATLKGAVHAPGGQLIQATDHWVGIYRARIVLIDDDECRAPVVAAWLALMGIQSVWLRGGDKQWPHIRGLVERDVLLAFQPSSLTRASLDDAFAPRSLCLDARPGMQYRMEHLPGSLWVNRSLLKYQLEGMPRDVDLIVLANDATLAACLAENLKALGFHILRWLEPDFTRWRQAGVAMEQREDLPSDDECIDFLFFVHDRHDGNLEASRRYLAWETGLVAQLDEEERGTFTI